MAHHVRGQRWILRQVDTAVEVPRWAFTFYLKHLPLVVGISLIPAMQRVVWSLWGKQLPAEVNVVLEMVTNAARLVLIVVIARLASADPGAGRGPVAERRGVWAFLWARWPSMIIQVALIGCLAFVFDFIPERVIAPHVPPSANGEYWAALLGLKNLTVIAYTMIWLIGSIRQAVVYPEPLLRPVVQGSASGRSLHGADGGAQSAESH
jgi:hypothetical protein